MVSFILKMKSIFKIAASAAMLLGALSAGCRRAPQTLVPPPPDGGDAQRLVTVLDYVSSDYARAVTAGGVVLSEAEYEEQSKFAADARALAASVLRSPPADDPLLSAVARVQKRVGEKADPAL